MSITAARLQAEVGADTKGFDSGMAHADRTIKAAPGKWATALKVGAGAGLALAGAFVVKGIAGAIRGGLASLTEQGVVVAQTNAVIRSTGAAANVTAAQIRDLSTALEAKTTVDDKVVQADANLLLTFRNVKNVAGAGNDIFSQSVAVFEDMKTAMPSSSMVQLGKALNDPLKGVTALTKVGVTFTEQQKAQFKANSALSKEEQKHYVALQKSSKATAERYKSGILANKQLASQKMILAELNKEFGGSGAAFAATDAGKALKFQDAIEGIQQKLTGALLPALTRVRGALTEALTDPATLTQVGALGDAIAAIFSEGNLKMAAGLMTTAAGAIGTAIKLFGSLPPEVQALAVGALALKKITGIGITDVVKSALGGLDLFKRGGTPANPLFVADVAGAVGGGDGLPGTVAKGGLATSVIAALPWAAVAAAAVGAVYVAAQATDMAFNPKTPGHDPNIAENKNPANVVPAVWEQVTENLGLRKPNAPPPGGDIGAGSDWTRRHGRDNALANLEKTPNQAILERAVARGLHPTLASIEATAARNATKLDLIRAAAADIAAAVRAKEFKVYTEFNRTILNNPNLNGPSKPVPVILSPRAVPNATRGTDLYGPVTTRNGRAAI